MKLNAVRVLAAVAAVAVAVILLMVLKDDGKSASEELEGEAVRSAPAQKDDGQGGRRPAPAPIPTVVVKDGESVGGILALTYDEGDQIRFKVESDTSDEIHVHGYDIAKEVEAGRSVTFSFPAEIEGVFEVELEGRGEQIAELTVNP